MRPARRMSRRRRKWLTIGVGFGVPLAIGVAGLGWLSAWSTATATGYSAPPFVLPDHEGRQIALADYLGRKPVVLVFYMTYG